MIIVEMEFSDILSLQNRTQNIESLADELDFYDQADENYTLGHDFGQAEDSGVYEVVDHRRQSVEVRQDLQQQVQEHSQESSKDSSEPDAKKPQDYKLKRQDTGSSGDVMAYVLCPNCMQGKEKPTETTSSLDISLLSGISEEKLKYLLNRDPMREFFKLTAQAVKLNSPYMESILTLHINQMYEQVVKSNTPFFKWSTWIEDYLHRTILSKIYAEAFESQSRTTRSNRRQSIRAKEIILQHKKENEGKAKEEKTTKKKGFSWMALLRRKRNKSMSKGRPTSRPKSKSKKNKEESKGPKN